MMEFSDFISELGLMDLPFLGGCLRCPTIPLGPDLIGFFSLRIGKLIILGSFRKRFPDCAWIIFLFSLTAVVFKRAKNLSNMRICG
jgi:hypothetical protein